MATAINESKINVRYTDNDKDYSREIKFKGNFGFSIDGQTFYTKNGDVYDSKGNKISILTLSKVTAYQFIGMSCTAEAARDYTYSEKDINEAKNRYNTPNYDPYSESPLETFVKPIIGHGAGKLVGASFHNNKYTTQYEANNNPNRVGTVSVWLVDNK